jgi:hypothetical protein
MTRDSQITGTEPRGQKTLKWTHMGYMSYPCVCGYTPSQRCGVAVDDAVRTVVRVRQARLFRLPIFPRAHLRQALAPYYIMRYDPTPSGGFPK